MICVKCHKSVADGPYCLMCGARQHTQRTPKKRGNGQGTVYKLPNGKYKAVVVRGYYVDDDGKQHRITRSKVCEKKKDAVDALTELKKTTTEKRKDITFKQLYDLWYPTHRAGKTTLGNYSAAFKYFLPVWGLKTVDIDIDDLQECVDDCPRGKRTKENMRTVCGLMYKYGLPRRAFCDSLNLADYITVTGEGAAHRDSFTEEQIALIRNGIGIVDYADYIYCLIYLGFRPSEFLALEVKDYNRDKKLFIGGAKTEAGTNRIVTVSPKIQPIIESIIGNRDEGFVFCELESHAKMNKDQLADKMYAVLEMVGIDNPMVVIGGGIRRHKYTPHSCRHTFATLLKRIEAPSKDKQELIGHASEEMLKYYQDVEVNDLKAITDLI